MNQVYQFETFFDNNKYLIIVRKKKLSLDQQGRKDQLKSYHNIEGRNLERKKDMTIELNNQLPKKVCQIESGNRRKQSVKPTALIKFKFKKI